MHFEQLDESGGIIDNLRIPIGKIGGRIIVRMRADVKDVYWKTTHAVGVLVGQGPTVVSRVPLPAAWVEIVEVSGGAQLYRYDSDGLRVADTWHLMVDEVKAQAEFEVGVRGCDWLQMDSV